jgi:hypothetical protein
MRAEIRSARYFLLTGIVFAVVTFFADPQYRNHISPTTAIFSLYFGCSLLSIGLSVMANVVHLQNTRVWEGPAGKKGVRYRVVAPLCQLTPTQQVLATPEHNKYFAISLK